MQFSIGQMILKNKFENRFSKPKNWISVFKPKTGFTVFEKHPYSYPCQLFTHNPTNLFFKYAQDFFIITILHALLKPGNGSILSIDKDISAKVESWNTVPPELQLSDQTYKLIKNALLLSLCVSIPLNN